VTGLREVFVPVFEILRSGLSSHWKYLNQPDLLANMTVNVFAVPVFFIVFRETLETAIIVSVLLAFLKQTLDGPNRDVAVYKKLVKQVRTPSKTSESILMPL